MRKMLIAAVLVAAGCADDEPTQDPHVQVVCDPASWARESVERVAVCHAACEFRPDPSPYTCEATMPPPFAAGFPAKCRADVFEWGGVMGCCLDLNGNTPVFAICIN